jgi:uncharacterized coiled-coil protein SlyX
MTEGRDEGLCDILDTNFTKMIHDLETYMRSDEDHLAKEQNDFHIPKIEALEAKIQEQEQAIGELESESSDNTVELARKEAVIARLVQVCARLHQRVRNGKSCSRSFNFWIEMSIDRPILVRAFKRIFFVNQVKRTLFRRWVRKMHRKREDRFVHEIQSRFEKEFRTKAADNNRILKSLEIVGSRSRGTRTEAAELSRDAAETQEGLHEGRRQSEPRSDGRLQRRAIHGPHARG